MNIRNYLSFVLLIFVQSYGSENNLSNLLKIDNKLELKKEIVFKLLCFKELKIAKRVTFPKPIQDIIIDYTYDNNNVLFSFKYKTHNQGYPTPLQGYAAFSEMGGGFNYTLLSNECGSFNYGTGYETLTIEQPEIGLKVISGTLRMEKLTMLFKLCPEFERISFSEKTKSIISILKKQKVSYLY